MKNIIILDENYRKELHKAFNKWMMADASEDEYQQFLELKEKICQGKPMSFMGIIAHCLEEQALLVALPQNLRKQLQEKNLLPS